MTKRALVLSITVLLLAFCSLGYAADFNVTDSAGFQTALTAAQSNGEDDTITLSAGIYLVSDNGGAFTYTAASLSEGTLTIIGSGEVILDGEGTSDIFDIDSSWMTYITLQGLNIQNGYDTNDGGGAYIEIRAGNINILECSFNDNESVTDDKGGALYTYISDNGEINVTSCDFTGNSTTRVSSSPEGGAVYAYIGDTGDINLQGNTFSDNSSGDDGGSAYLECSVGDMDIIGNTFTSNDAGSNGGALYIEQDYSGTVTIHNNEFTSNTASDEGGAVYIDFDDAANTSNISGNTFTDNEASSNGGALYIEGDYSSTNILSNNDFSGNKSDSYGGGAYIDLDYGGIASITSNDFLENQASSDGGGLYVEGEEYGNTITVDDCLFRENESEGNGGGLFADIDDGGWLFLTNSEFTDNKSTGGEGGGAHIGEYYCNIHVSGNTFTGNMSEEYGGGLYSYVDEGNIYVANSTFDNNVVSSDNYGGGAYLYCEDGNLTVDSCAFTENSCGSEGGGLYTEQVYGDFIFTNNLVANNTSANDGGGAYFYPEYVRYADIVNNTVTGNTVTEAGYYGGGIYVYCGDDNTVYSLYNNIVWDNAASDGDDIYFYDNSYLNYFYVNNNDFSVLSNDFSASSDLYETANLDVDPLFVSATDFRLQGGSPVIDMGDSNAPSLPEIDLDGNARVYGENVDMGAYEFGSGSIGDDVIGEDDTTESTSGGGSGGCNAGAFSPALILLLAPLLLLARKK